MTPIPEEHQRLRIDLAAYALGQLDDARAREVAEHLAGCADCRGELEELRPAASALAEVRREGASGLDAPEVAVPDGLADRVLSSVAREHRRERRSMLIRGGLLGATAAAVVLIAGWAVVRPGVPEPLPLEPVVVDVGRPAIEASADLVPHTWGVEVKLRATGLDLGARYQVVVLGLDGERYPAGEFVGTGDREMLCNLNSSVLRDAAAGFEVQDADGVVVVSSDFGT